MVDNYNTEEVFMLFKSIKNRRNVVVVFKNTIKSGSWKDYTTALGQPIKHDDFFKFIKGKFPYGLSCDPDTLYTLIKHDAEALELWDRVTKREVGGDKKSEEYKITVDNVNSDLNSRPTGNSKQHGIRALRKHRPDLLDKVTNNELSVNAAMVQAGLRKKTVTIPVGDLERAANVLKKNFSDDEIIKLWELLNG